MSAARKLPSRGRQFPKPGTGTGLASGGLPEWQAARQRGQALLLVVVLLGVGVAVFVYNYVNPAAHNIERDKITNAALAQSKDALIGFAATHSTRPGALPCPDTNNDGNGEPANSSPGGNSCPSYIGRLPWKSLGLPDLRDGSGERLWYFLSPNFRNANPPSGPVLNSETLGQISTASGIKNVIAMIVAPGPVLGTQDRTSADAAKINSAANYLENQVEIAGITYTFASGIGTNDRLMVITREIFFPPVEIRVARELRRLLVDYYDLPPNTAPSYTKYFPFAAAFSGTTACVEGTYRGRVPTSPCPPLNSLASTLPPWFGHNTSTGGNKWNEVMVYAVAPRCTPKLDGGTSIDPSSIDCNNTVTAYGNSYLTIGASDNIEAIIISAGYRLDGQLPPCSAAAACLEDQENTDGPSGYPTNTTTDGPNNLIFVKPRRSENNNDSLIIVKP